jgi:hypothetical protein
MAFFFSAFVSFASSLVFLGVGGGQTMVYFLVGHLRQKTK